MKHLHVLALATIVIGSGCSSLGTPTNIPLPNDPLVAISYSPGFIGTPPWEVRVTPDGRIFLQATTRVDSYSSTHVYEQHALSPSQVRSLAEVIESAKLNELRGNYEFGGTDQETLSIRTNTDHPADIRVYGPQKGCDLGEIQRFLRVWNAVVTRVSVPTTKYTKHLYTRCYTEEASVHLWLAADAVPFVGLGASAPRVVATCDRPPAGELSPLPDQIAHPRSEPSHADA